MLQVPFGSPGPGWITLPSPGVGWFPAPMAPTGPSLSGAQLQGSSPMPTADTGSFGWGAHGMTVPMTPLPLSTPFVVPDGITAAVLLAAIAQRRGQPQGPTSDNDVEEFIYDALEVLPGAQDVEVRCEGGRVTLTGSVPHKRLKRDVGEIAWAIPGINDVQNNAGIATRRRSRGFAREGEAPPSAPSRKQS